MSDLQCAATVLLVQHRVSESESRRLGRSLRSARLAAIYTAGSAEATRTAGIVGDETGVPVTVLDQALDRSAELEGIADLHRGETVLVVAPLDLAGGAVVEVTVDADGWVLRSWDGDPGDVRDSRVCWGQNAGSGGAARGASSTDGFR